jgi:phosphoribosylformimino-5-aminoimidazole carboxamide ribotide isomerase
VRVIPAVDMMDGMVVQLVGGVPGTERIVLPDPVKVAQEWESLGAPAIHAVDLDAALDRGNNLDSIMAIIREVSIPVQVGGGIRSQERVDQLLEAGASAVVIGTRAIREPEWLEKVSREHPRRAILALDVKEGMIQVRGWQESSGISAEEMFKRIEGLPLSGVLHTNVDVEGQAKGIAAEDARTFIQRCPFPVISSGGITTVEDITALESMGAEAVVIGVALYTGRLDPKEIWGDKA